jgi:hypothetical protein
MKATLGLAALLVLPATGAFAAECDRNDFAWHEFRDRTGGTCEYGGDIQGKLIFVCRNPRLAPMYFKFFTQDNEFWPYAVTQTNVCFSDTDRCVIWNEGHCTCDECVLDAVLE